MRDVCLTIGPAQDRREWAVSLQTANAETVANARVPPLDLALVRSRYLAPMQQLVSGQFPESLVRELGEQMATVLFPANIWEAVCSLRGTEPVRIRLQMQVPALQTLPWEYVYLPPEGYLCLQRDVQLVRCAVLHSETAPASASKIRVLVVVADPDAPGYPALPGVSEEVEAIREALVHSVGEVSVEVLDTATPSALQARLQRSPAPEVVHFVGHSDTRPSGSFLLLHASEAHSATPLFAEDLARWLPMPKVRLVVLASCLSAGSAQGMAEVLSQQGVSMVLAMQARVRDQTASAFSRAFYTALASGEPVDTAVWTARTRLRDLGADWGAPVLFLNSAEADLIATSSAGQPPESLLNTVPFVPNPNFVGRQGFLRQLHRALSGTTPVALVGLPGMGKTQVAVEYARSFASSYPGGVFWLDASSSQRLVEQYAAVAGELGMAGGYHTAREAAQGVRDYLGDSQRSTLVVLDNLSDLTERTWFPHGGHCHVLVTTRHAYLVHEGYLEKVVPPLDEESALTLLQSRREAQDEVERESAAQLAALVGYVPLALSLIASHVARLQCSFQEYLLQMRNPLDALQQARYTFQSVTGHDGSIHDALSVCWRGLSEDAQEVLEAMAAVQTSSLSVRLLRLLCAGMDAGRFEHALAELEDEMLAERLSGGRLRLHELVKLFVQELADAQKAREYRQRACGILAEWLEEAPALGRWEGVHDEFHTARVLLSTMRGTAPSEERLSLMLQLAIALSEHSNYEEAVPLLEESLAHIQALHPDEPARAAECMRRLGYVCEQARLPDKAVNYARTALQVAQRYLPCDAPDIVEYLTVMGYVLKMTGNLAEAQFRYEQAHQRAVSAYGREHPAVATILNNLGTLHEAWGDYIAATEQLQQALEIDEALYGREHTRVAIRLNNLGRVLTKRGDYSSAVRCHQDAASIYEKRLGESTADVGISLVYLGDALKGMRDIEGARAAYCRALDVLERVCRSMHPDILVVRRRLEEL